VDPTVLDALEHAGYAGSRDRQPPAPLADALAAAPARRPAAPRRASRWREMALDPSRRLIRLPAGVRLDLGGSAKGLAADLAADLLAGHAGYAVDAGGDLRIGGTRPAPRTVQIEHPLRDGIAHRFTVTRGAVATCGLRTRVWPTAGGFAHHLIDPARGVPAWTGVIQASALAPTALEAETLAKTALLRGPHAGIETLARHGGALILDDGQLILAGGLATADRVAA
jgi:thiamine biosynthesis lipoprotein